MSRPKTFHISALGQDVLAGLYAHRLLSSRQVRELYAPAATMRWTLAALADLEHKGLVARVGVGGERETAWYLTAGGSSIAGHGGETRPYKMTPERAAGPLQAHTLATNEVGLAFVRAARDYGDDCTASSWRNETAHRLGGRSDTLIADAVLEYTAWDDEQSTLLVRCVEIDRATRPVHVVARQLEAYDRLARRGHTYPPPLGVLVVMVGRDRGALSRRLASLSGLLAGSKTLARSEVVISLTTLDDLVDLGPHEAIWRRPGFDGALDLLGRVPEGAH